MSTWLKPAMFSANSKFLWNTWAPGFQTSNQSKCTVPLWLVEILLQCFSVLFYKKNMHHFLYRYANKKIFWIIFFFRPTLGRLFCGKSCFPFWIMLLFKVIMRVQNASANHRYVPQTFFTCFTLYYYVYLFLICIN